MILPQPAAKLRLATFAALSYMIRHGAKTGDSGFQRQRCHARKEPKRCN
jgi:hypothetical protein